MFRTRILPETQIHIGIDQCLEIKATSRRGFKCTSKQKDIRCPCTFSAQLLQDQHVSAYLAGPQNFARTLTSFNFIGLSWQNPEMAIFQSTYMGRPDEAAILRIIKGTCTPDMAENPRHLVVVRNVANDTALPGLDIHFGSWLLTCRWKDMLTRFYGEEVLKRKKFEELVQKDPAIPRGPYQLPPCYISDWYTFFQDQGVHQYDIDKHNKVFLEAYCLTRRQRLRRAAEGREGRPLRRTRNNFQENEDLAVDDCHIYHTAPTHNTYYGPTVGRIGLRSPLNLVCQP
ncbi:MAG: hypothetical protein LQ350_002679 [Teloschistes chrysophthalmus]|nr:MAG: hypothetical protein LQ350_002679 [Niorma chrysophthalma]